VVSTLIFVFEVLQNEVSMLTLEADPGKATSDFNLKNYVKNLVTQRSRTNIKSLTQT
jgi:hypothetical protein